MLCIKSPTKTYELIVNDKWNALFDVKGGIVHLISASLSFPASSMSQTRYNIPTKGYIFATVNLWAIKWNQTFYSQWNYNLGK